MADPFQRDSSSFFFLPGGGQSERRSSLSPPKTRPRFMDEAPKETHPKVTIENLLFLWIGKSTDQKALFLLFLLFSRPSVFLPSFHLSVTGLALLLCPLSLFSFCGSCSLLPVPVFIRSVIQEPSCLRRRMDLEDWEFLGRPTSRMAWNARRVSFSDQVRNSSSPWFPWGSLLSCSR